MAVRKGSVDRSGAAIGEGPRRGLPSFEPPRILATYRKGDLEGLFRPHLFVPAYR